MKTHNVRPNLKVILLAVAILLPACGDDDDGGGDTTCSTSTSTLTLTAYGEDFIEEEIPADETDGWSIVFDQFLTSIGPVTARRSGCGDEASASTTMVFDLAASSGGSGHQLAALDSAEGLYDSLDYRIAPPGSDAVAANASDAQLTELMTSGASVLASGTATHTDGTTKTFSWAIPGDTLYAACETSADVPGGESQLTIHGDHLFYDDLVSDEPGVAFDIFARADDAGDGDGEVTQAEMEAFDIRGESGYGTGNVQADNLWDYLVAATATVGHIDGEGHCDTE